MIYGYKMQDIVSCKTLRLEKYLNIQDCLEKSLKIKFALKYKIVVPLFGAAFAAPNKGTTSLY